MKLLPRVFIVAAIPVIFGIAMMTILAYLVSAQEAELSREKNARAAISDGMTLSTALSSGAMAVFEYASTQTESTLRPYLNCKDKVEKAVSRLKTSMADRPQQLEKVKRIEAECNKTLTLAQEVVDLIRLGGTNFAPMRLREVRELVNDQIVDNKLDTEIAGLDVPYVQQNDFTVSQYRQLIGVLLYGGAAFAVVLSVLMPLLLSRQVTSRLNVIVENSKRLALRAPLLNRVQGADEIAELDQQFHEMAALLEQVSRQERAILANAGAVIFTIDQDSKIMEIANECEKVWGYGAEDLFGRRLITLVKSDCIDDLRRQLQSIDPGSTSTFEEDFVKSDGEFAVMLLSVHNGSERKVGEQKFYCVAHDITERKQLEKQLRESEAKVRSLVQNLPAGLMLIDQYARVRFANDSALNLFHVSSFDDGMVLQRLQLPHGATSIFELAFERSGQSLVSSIKTDGSETPIELSLNVAEIDNEKFVLAILADITERLTIDRIKHELLRTMSDDVAEPMGQIAQVLIRLRSGELGNLTEKAYSRLDVSVNESDRLLRLFDDFLRIRMGDELFEVTLKPCLLSEIVNRAAGAVAVKAAPKRITVVPRVAECQINADSERIVQVLVNLLTNAIKFSPQQGSIIISSDIVNGAVQIRVRDQGSGIPATALQTIFEPFKQVAVTDATRKGGTGLGLAICKSIVDKHGGRIWALNNEDTGASFFVSLPLAMQ